MDLGFVLSQKLSRPCGSDSSHEERGEAIAGGARRTGGQCWARLVSLPTAAGNGNFVPLPSLLLSMRILRNRIEVALGRGWGGSRYLHHRRKGRNR